MRRESSPGSNPTANHGSAADADSDRHAGKLLELAAQRTIELVYFAHIDQADWADHVLAKYGIGRPHHRVLYFANKKPGISVRELMTVLRITNQALARTTTQLVDIGFLEQRYSAADRRVRQHFVTSKGSALLAKLTRHQVARVAAELQTLGDDGIASLWRGMEALIRPQDRPWLIDHPLSSSRTEAKRTDRANAERPGRAARLDR